MRVIFQEKTLNQQSVCSFSRGYLLKTYQEYYPHSSCR